MKQRNGMIQKMQKIAQLLMEPANFILQEAAPYETRDHPVRRYEVFLFYCTLWVTAITFFFIKVSSLFLHVGCLPFLFILYLGAWVIVISTLAILILNVLIPPRVSAHRFAFIFIGAIQLLLLVSLNAC